MRMRSLAGLLLAAALAGASGEEAAPAPKPMAGYGYAYFLTAGTCCTFGNVLGAGLGGDAMLYKGLAAGLDLGYVFPRSDPGCGIGLLSANPSYHFVKRAGRRKLMPFVTAGYGLAFRSQATSVLNYGGGLTWWLSEKKGIRVEVRDYRDRCGGSLFVVRTAFAFR